MADAFDALITLDSQEGGSQASSQAQDPLAALHSFIGDAGGTTTQDAPQDVPPTVQEARHYIGQQAYQGLCQQFAEAITDHKTGEFPSAVDAFNSYAQNKQAYQGLTGVTPGSLVYFSPNQGNGYAGHVGIYSGNGNFISATDNGIQELPIDEWTKQTSQSVLGYVPK